MIPRRSVICALLFRITTFPSYRSWLWLQLVRCLLQGVLKQQRDGNEKTPFWLNMSDPDSQTEWYSYQTTRMSWLNNPQKKGMDFVKGTSWYIDSRNVYACMLNGN